MKVHFPSSELLWYGQVKVTRMILALIRLRWAISWVLSTWVKQFYRCPLAKVIPALCYWISPWSAGVETLKASWDAWIKLGRFPIVLRMFFLCIIGYWELYGIVLQFHDAMGLLWILPLPLAGHSEASSTSHPWCAVRFVLHGWELVCDVVSADPLFVRRFTQTKNQGNHSVSDS